MRARANNARSRRTTLRGAARAVAVALLAIAPSAHALHCGTRVIDRGDDAAKLLEFCGEPANVESRRIERTSIDANGRVYRGFTEEVVVDECTYNIEPYQLRVNIQVVQRDLADLQHLGHG